MNSITEYYEAASLLLDRAVPVSTETVPLTSAAGRVLAEPLISDVNVPPFDRSPYDGYTFRAEDTQNAVAEAPCVLSITEEIPSGAVPQFPITCGKAAKILTGAPIPQGADAVIMFEETEFTEDQVKRLRKLRYELLWAPHEDEDIPKVRDELKEMAAHL